MLHQTDLPGSNILFHHGYHLLLPQKDLKLLVVPLVQFTALVPQLLIRKTGGVALLLERLRLLVVPALHIVVNCSHRLQEG